MKAVIKIALAFILIFNIALAAAFKHRPKNKKRYRLGWSSRPGVTGHENALRHARNHRNEFPGSRKHHEYISGAWAFLHHPPRGTKTKIRPNGDVIRYHRRSNTFAAMTSSGTPKTMFKPKEKRKYWRRRKGTPVH